MSRSLILVFSYQLVLSVKLGCVALVQFCVRLCGQSSVYSKIIVNYISIIQDSKIHRSFETDIYAFCANS